MEAALSLRVYAIFDDGTEVVYSGAFAEDGKKKAFVHFERPTNEGFDSLRAFGISLDSMGRKVLRRRACLLRQIRS